MSQYFCKLCSHFHGNVSVELDLSNCARKFDIEKATGVDTST